MQTSTPTVMTLEHLPLVGRNVIVFTKGGMLRVPHARILRDDKHLHINVIAGSAYSQFPAIASTTEVPIDEALNITFEDEHEDRYVLLPV